MKKTFAILLAIMMVLSLAAPAFAAEDTCKLTVNTTGYADRTFNAYKIMSATNDGNNFNYVIVDAYRTHLMTALGLLPVVDETTDAQDTRIMTAIAALNTEGMIHFSDALYRAILADANITPDVSGWNGSTKEVAQGYWLIADVTENLADGEARSVIMMDTAGDADVTVNLKADSTEIKKNVDDENDSIKAEISGNEDSVSWDTSADYDIGDQVPFQITGQMVNDVTSYNYYAFRIVDTTSKGLTHLPDTIELYLNGTKQTIKAADAEGTANWIYEITSTTDGGSVLTVYPNFGYTKKDGTVVTASASAGGDFLKLFEEGTAHDKINSSTWTLRYSCLLNENAELKNVNEAVVYVSNNPYGDGETKTPKDTTVTFTYNFVVDKVDPQGNPLTGATFALYKFIAEGQGEYTGTETVAATAAEAALNGTYFNHPSANCYGKYVVVDELTVNDEGTKFTFKGIDDGYYVLIETAAPDGYKAIEPVEFHVVASHTENEVTELKAVLKTGSTLDGDESTGTLTTVIENHTGSELPSTGGMGTTLFYVCGSMMVLAAIVLLVSKKRMSV